MVMWLDALRMSLLDGFSLRGNLLVGLARWGIHMTRGYVRWIIILLRMGMGHVAAWRMAIRRPKDYRSKVDPATRCRVLPRTDCE